LDLYVYLLPKLASLFFAFNHPNYARWLVRYHSNLLSIDETHPGLAEELANGLLSVRRTTKSFSRMLIDYTLETTQNADAANSLTGITAFTNSISARQRWGQSHAQRTAVISNLLEKLGLNKKDEVCRDLRQSRINKDRKQLDDILSLISNIMDPFKLGASGSSTELVNIATGKAASEES
jgi:hypothetical protein